MLDSVTTAPHMKGLYIDGQWQNFDTTPANWADIEDQEAKGFTFIGDFFSWTWLQLKNIFGNIFTLSND